MSAAGDRPSDDVEIDRKVEFLARPASYPGAVGRVQTVETHMSWVFLADGLAWKLKKPVRLPFQDFGTVEARRRNCEQEVRLNRRLAPDVYLGAVPLTLKAGGELAVGGRATAVDWLVKMRRLPEAGMLDHALAAGEVPSDRLEALVALLVRFYGEAPAVAWPPGEYVRRLVRDVEHDTRELVLPRYGLPAARVRAVLAIQRDFLARAAERFEGRARAGRVVEGHGDLRPEHVCLDPGPLVIDCLEFNREFRLLDPIDELAFLALECERLGRAEVGRRILDLYAAESGDIPDPLLVSFHKAHRACVRARIAVWHLRDADVADPRKWVERGLTYLKLAEKYAADLRPDE